MSNHRNPSLWIAAKSLAGAAGLGAGLVLTAAPTARADDLLPVIVNPQFTTIDAADAGGNAVSGPVTGTLTPGSFTVGTNTTTYGGTAVPTVSGAISFSDSNSYPSVFVPGWTQTLPGSQGVEHGASTAYAGQPYFLYVNGPDEGGQNGGYLIYQDLGPASSVLTPQRRYILSVDVGHRADAATMTNDVLAGLFIGTAAPAIGSNGTDHWWDFPDGAASPDSSELGGGPTLVTDLTPTAGTFATWQYTYITPSVIPAGDLYVLLGTWSGSGGVTGAQTDFTDVVLTVPEPASLVLLGLGAAAFLRRRRA
jgi:hypothetical protein